MELGISTLLWYEEPDLVPCLPLLEAAGVRLIEIRRCPQHFDYANVVRMRRLSSALQKHGVAVHSLHVADDLCAELAAGDEQTRKHAVAEVARVACGLVEIGGQRFRRRLEVSGAIEAKGELEMRREGPVAEVFDKPELVAEKGRYR